MDAAEDPGDAQLCWSSKTRPDPDSQQRPCLHRVQDSKASLGSLKDVTSQEDRMQALGTFDLFGDTTAGLHSSKDLELDFAAIPPAVQVHDLAVDDCPAEELPGFSTPPPASKQFQDDLSTPCLIRKPWAEVEDDDDIAGYHFFEDLDDDAAADADSRVLQKRGETSTLVQHARDTLPDVGSDEVCALGNSDTLGYDYSLGPQSDIPAALHKAPTQAGGERCLPVDWPADSGEYMGGCGTMHVDFMTHAREILPDVYPASGDESSITEDAQSDAGVESIGSHDVESVGSLRTQCGPMPLQHKQTPCPQTLAQYAPQVPVRDVDLTEEFAPRMQTLRTQCGPLPQQHFQTSGASTLAQHAPQEEVRDIDLTDYESAPAMQTLRTQCGHLPQQSLQTPCPQTLTLAQHAPQELARDVDLTAEFAPGLQTLRTQCGPLPQQHFPPCTQTTAQYAPQGLVQQASSAQADLLPFDALADTLTHLVAAASDSTSTHEDRLSSLKAYAAATNAACEQFALWEKEQQALHTPLASGTQCGPVPQQHSQTPGPQTLAQHAPQEHVREEPSAFGSSPDQVAKEKKDCEQAQQSPLVSGTQCRPLPQQSMQTPFKEPPAFGSSSIQAAKEMKDWEQAQHAPLVSGTQCGPMPQQHSQTPCPPTLAQEHVRDDLTAKSAPAMRTPRTQCGPLP